MTTTARDTGADSTRALPAMVWLVVTAAAVAELIGAVSLTRIAGQHLGFPHYLEWTLTASVAVGAVAGAIMWSIGPEKSQTRSTGVRLNVACSLLCAVGVGLDHAANATARVAWQIIAFAIGAFLPLLSTWLVHALAKLGGTGTSAAENTGEPTPAAPPTTVSELVQQVAKPPIADDPATPEPPRQPLHVAPEPPTTSVKPWGPRAQRLIAEGKHPSTAYRTAKKEWRAANDGRPA